MKTSICVAQCPGKTSAPVTCPTVANGATGLDTVAPFCNNGKSEGVHVTYKTYTFVKYCIPSEGLTTSIKDIWDDMLSTL